MHRLLYLQNSPTSESAAGVAERLRSMEIDVTVARAYLGDLPSDSSRYDAVYVSGSPHGAYDDVSWIHREHERIRSFARSDIPMLGVCFGSQILASALCGRDQVFRRETCEVGYVSLTLTSAATEDALMRGILGAVRMFVWHNDEVRAGHADMRILASSDECPNHIWRFRDMPIWGIQGHPEVAHDASTAWLELNRPALERDGADVDALVRDRGADPEVDVLISNFIAAIN